MNKELKIKNAIFNPYYNPYYKETINIHESVKLLFENPRITARHPRCNGPSVQQDIEATSKHK